MSSIARLSLTISYAILTLASHFYVCACHEMGNVGNRGEDERISLSFEDLEGQAKKVTRRS